MRKQSLNGTWQLFKLGDDTAISATVPGCVHTDLIANNLLPDPFYRDNEANMQWIGETDWLYRRTFEVTQDFLTHQQVLLRCAGLDTLATIRINGTQIAKTDNMYRTYEFNVKKLLHVGENTLDIELAAPLPYTLKLDAEKREMVGWVAGMRLTTGAWIRKEPCNFGWDWGPMLPTSGIWRDIDLIGIGQARIDDLHITQTHSDNHVTVTVALGITPHQKDPVTAVVSLARDGLTIIDTKRVTFDGDSSDVTFEIENPALWYPNGMGKQPLYEILVGVFDRDLNSLDHTSLRFGLRVIQLERHDDEWGESFYFSCNGVPFFAKGANWIPASPFAGQTSPKEYRKLLQAAKDANMNMMRVWGGGIYEDDVFYDICDELGITVWQDFMFACGTYPSFDADFMATVKAEAEDNVRRIRHHACLALWCGNNEIEQGMGSDDWHEIVSWEDYSLLFDDLLPRIVEQFDGQTDYWPGSPHSPKGDRNDWINPNWGDTHLWMVWHGKQPFEWYRTRPDRFCSEFGFQSFPEPAMVNEFTLPEDHDILSPVMQHHQRSPIGNSTITHYQKDWFRDPKDFPSELWLSQILQGMAMKYAIEHWRRNMPRTMGTLYWQFNDMWPAASWSALDWKGNWKALQYMTKRFYAPVLLSALENTDNNTVEIHITSDFPTAQPTQAHWFVSDTHGKIIDKGLLDATLPVRASLHVDTLDVSQIVAEYGASNLIIWLELHIDNAIVSENLVTLSRPRQLDLQQPTISIKARQMGGDRYQVTLQTDVPALYVWLELKGAQFSDNFFHLRPEQAKTVLVSASALVNLKVNSLIDTYQ
ncbi:MAG: glycoside hydrolase family 2 protein [Phototrophicaceae bacterium]